ncbi:MAG: CHAT domain-containing protein/Flp pilus assembly protein TadD [Patiriisocius sp.]|jgi:CHAT domain-containing protein/Flp pilus assembly protein TadD
MPSKILSTLILCAASFALYGADLASARLAAESGDSVAALDQYMEILAEIPGNPEALEGAANQAMMLDIPDLAADLWVQRVDLAIAQGDRETAQLGNEVISAIYETTPAWVQDASENAGAYSDEQGEAMVVIDEMTVEAQNALNLGDFENAIAAQESALMIAQDLLGNLHGMTIAVNRDLGFIYRQIGMAEEAGAFYTEALAAAEEVLGPNHPDTLGIQSLIAELYGAIGMANESDLTSQRVVAGYSESLGANHPLVLDAKFGVINQLQATNQFDNALMTVGELCSSIESAYGSYHPQAIYCLQTTAGILTVMGQLAEAEVTYGQVIDRMGAVKTDVDVYVLNALLEVAEIYRVLGRYQQSKDLLSGIIHTALLVGDVERSYTAKSYLGRVLNNEGDYENAELLTQEVLDYGTIAWQSIPQNVYNTLLELGSIYQAQGRFADAEATYKEALQGLQELFGDTNPSVLVASNNLGQIYEISGLYDQAEPLLKQTLNKMEKILGEDHVNTLNSRNNLALLYESQGNFREAEPLYVKSLDMMLALYGEDHTNTNAVKNNLAYLYMLMENYEQSAEIFEDVRVRWQTLFGESHANTLKATNNLGRVYKREGKLDLAEARISEALALRQKALGKDHIDAIRSMIDLGGVYIDQERFEDAKKILSDALALAESQLGNLHPYTFEALNYLAQAMEEMNDLQASIELREKGFVRRSEFFDTMLWSTGENAREGYIRLHRPEFNAYMSLLARIGDEESARRMIDASLQRKGLLLKVTSEIQQIATMATDPELKGLATQLSDARKELAAKTLSGPTVETKGNHVQVLYDLEQIVNEVQGKLGRASVRFRTSVAGSSAERLTDSMREDSALVDFMAYTDKDEPKFLASVITKEGDEVTFHLVQFSDRDALEESIVLYRELIQDDQADEDYLLEVGIEAYDYVWSPLMEVLGDLAHVYLIPDGLLNIAPFGALMNPDEEYLIQTHDLQILTSGRDLLPSEYRLAEGEYLVVAGPNYDSDEVVSKEVIQVAAGRRSAALQLGIRGAGTGLRGLNFAPLPGAAQEGKIIVDRVASDNFFADNAQEQVLVGMKTPPEVLHVATHGFFLKADENLKKRLLKAQRGTETHIPPPGDNPLLRAGLAFAGINTNAPFLGEIETTNDGVLTALEVLDLNLSGTKLVVLSACETGLGEIHEGEGVYGLRRAFQEAGVAEVVSSLWEVSDAGTQALMTDFYDRLLAGEPAREALRNTQLDMIDSPQWGYPYVWSAFMIVGSYESAGFAVN